MRWPPMCTAPKITWWPQDRPGCLEVVDVVRRKWEDQEDRYGAMFASRADQEVVVSRTEYEEIVMLCMVQAAHTELLGQVQRWAMDPISRVFARLAMQAKQSASHMGKLINVQIEHNDVRLPATGMQGLWASLVHLVRNALDHGIEPPSVRKSLGKPESGRFTMRAEMTDDNIVLTFEDDGQGIDWNAVARRAQEQGLAAQSEQDLKNALFASGVSTVLSVGTNAGRGIGTSAFQQATQDLGGTVEVASVPGQGTTFTLNIPLASLATMGLVS